MDRRELEHAAVRGTYLRGLFAIPVGLLFWLTGLGNLGWAPLAHPAVFLGCLGLLALLAYGINRFYDDRYGRVSLTREKQVRFTVASFFCFGIPMVAGTVIDFRLDLPVSAFAVLFGLGMLAWFAYCVGLRTYHLVVWGALIAVGLLPVWAGFADRASVGWLPAGLATIIAGILDHRALARSFGPVSDRHVGV